jgi:hypothetical protein
MPTKAGHAERLSAFVQVLLPIVDGIRTFCGNCRDDIWMFFGYCLTGGDAGDPASRKDYEVGFQNQF